jgi:tRNA(Ile)-lysidine synthetase-like protein
MIHIVGGKLPRKLCVALSGGPDSMAILDFLIRGGRDVTALHFDHGTEHGKEARAFVTEYCIANRIPLIVGTANREQSPDESPEEFWRNMRYDFFNEIHTYRIVTAHTLDDQVENWIFTSLHGMGRLIPYRRAPNIVRPFLTTTKADLLDWCDRKNIPFVTDPGNSDEKYMRSLIRTKIIPEALRVNPGLFKVIKKKVLISL